MNNETEKNPFTGVEFSELFNAPAPGQDTPRLYMWVSVLVLFVTLHSRFWFEKAGLSNDHLEIYTEYLLPFRRILFLGSLIIVSAPFAMGIHKSVKSARQEEEKNRDSLVGSFAIFCTLCFLVFPFAYPEVLSETGVDYFDMTRSPLEYDLGFFDLRVLKPLLAKALMCDSRILYFAFSMTLTFLVIFLSGLLFRRIQVGTNPLFLFSWCTSSYILYDYYAPGNVDNLIFALMLVSVLIKMNASSWLSVVSLGLLTHPLSAFTIIPLALLTLPLRHVLTVLTVCCIYGLFWLPELLFGANQAFITSNLGLLRKNADIPLGFLAAWKVFIVFIPIAIWVNTKKKNYGRLFVALSLLAAPVVPLVISRPSEDSSRYLGWGFIGLALLARDCRENIGKGHLWITICTLNIVIPFTFVYGITVNPPPHGIYAIICKAITKFIH